ncbi:hypothetical protein NDU88_006915 [Pleurodeles waltl]|uniref:Uncharacterized protein n=1 Tax=Pleurodeles waltl TaxID=8319 RepID=A0AAV7RMV9_PLEWA|nr:hypothetical protein NDU88_006915 [Pleurodeles waltl]
MYPVRSSLCGGEPASFLDPARQDRCTSSFLELGARGPRPVPVSPAFAVVFIMIRLRCGGFLCGAAYLWLQLFSVVFALRWWGLDTFPGPAQQARRTSNPTEPGARGPRSVPDSGTSAIPPGSPRSGGGQPGSQLPCTARARPCDTSAPPAHPARAWVGRSAARAAHLPGGGPRRRGPHSWASL